MDILSPLAATFLGFIGFNALTHDQSRFKKHLPNIIIGKIQIFPVLRIHLKGKTLHLHHWFNFSLILGYSLVASAGIFDHMITRGLLVGGILQGLSLPKEYRRLIYRDHPVLPPIKPQ